VWGLTNPKTGTIAEAYEPRAVGVQTNPISSTDSLLVFAVNTYGRFSNLSASEFYIDIDVNGDGVADFILFSGDIGAWTLDAPNGQIGSLLFNVATGAITLEFLADAPTDASTVLIPVLASDLGISPANPRFTYTVSAFDTTFAEEDLAGTASFNAFSWRRGNTRLRDLSMVVYNPATPADAEKIRSLSGSQRLQHAASDAVS
jgi:hypothetical protein